MMRRDWRLYVITEGAAPGRSHAAIAEAAIAGGATAVQLRMKTEPARAALAAAREIRAACRAAGVTFIVNDRVDVALLAGADGVHLGQDDLPAAEVRALMGPHAVIGVSAATVAEAEAAARAGADYLGVGAVYATATKADAGAPVGLGRLSEIRRAVRLPVVGIAGITPDTAPAVIRAGADGVAVITAVSRAPDMAAAVRRLREAVDGARGR
jgi:thiamine-phosphate pyrophosphorylase